MFVDTETIKLLLPEAILIAMATWIMVAGAFAGNSRFWSVYAILCYLVAGYALYRQGMMLADAFAAGQTIPSGPLSFDQLAYIVRFLALATGLVVTLMSAQRTSSAGVCESLGLVMLATAGGMLTSAANELVLLFVGLELISVPTYALLFLGRPGRSSAEATAKYFFLSVLSSALLLYGFSFLYGMGGTTALFGAGSVVGIHDVLSRMDTGLVSLAPLAAILIFAGLGFKLAAVPFHFYAPDVYQGTTNANAALLAVMPKLAGAVALVRLSIVLLPALTNFAWQLVLVVSVLSMTVGNVCALWQTNVRRMLAYSSIAHAGYLLIGLAVFLGNATFGQPDATTGYGGAAALVFYLVVYAFGSLGAFAVLAHLSDERREVGTLDELAGLNKTQPIAAGLMAVFMFSQAGIPIFAGFWGKLTLFTGAVSVYTQAGSAPNGLWFLALAVIAALNAAIGAAYYLRVVGALYFRPSAAQAGQRENLVGLAAAVICCLVVMVVGLLPGQLASSARLAEKPLHNPPRGTVSLAVGGDAVADSVAR
jgi:NADH-quinone oxidoreductase subunit N